MNWVDYLILAIIALSVLLSVWRGFTREALSLAGWIAAFWIAIAFSDNLIVLLARHVDSPTAQLLIAFAVLFIVTLLLAALITYLAGQIIQKSGLSGTDRMLGIFFGIARGLLVVALLVLIGGMTPLPQENWWREAQLMHYFESIALWLAKFMPPELAKNIHYR
ncbi:MAG TPA: CvpA family protein [Gammaproteobacteria bacterium]